jgi:hypothetical protein
MSNPQYQVYQLSGNLNTMILSGLVSTMMGKFVSSITSEFFFPVINDILGDPKFSFNGLDIDLSNTFNSFLMLTLVYGTLKYSTYIKLKDNKIIFKNDGKTTLKDDLFFMIKFIFVICLIGFILLIVKTNILERNKYKVLEEEKKENKL